MDIANVNKTQLMQSFLLTMPAAYHAQSLLRVAHLSPNSLRKASVLVGFVERENGLNIVLTKRAAHLKHHPGQISFPGGKYEESDGSLYQTAKREAQEEIGVSSNEIEILGQLPELVTVSHFAVTPVVAFIDANYKTRIDRNEVEEVFEIPANYLLDQRKLYSSTFQIQNTLHRVFAIPYKHHFIWGMTAQIIQALQNHINLSR
ncbi:MutT/nudix family protein [Vibrio cincinnatiensis]|uniref:NUDIX domain-containing protein n=1 Tax=Vibrio cincinnatiensis DSM 19608 TaxID=1123491 RepID=A0A1T4LXK8_VIBCI|nr:NUDIX domain-containing protein [Vibrio cincinnatiensis DSM 19608]SUP06377.1 MutT/nudix family protein [Vibrio cincinnatiensis]